MATRLPDCAGSHVKKALERYGFRMIRVNGSHHIMESEGPPVRRVTVPVHGHRSLKRATLAAIIKQSGLTVEEFVALLR